MSNFNSNRKGIILAGGSGSRLYPLTKVISKQLLPVYDKPMIYYPLSTLMLSGIRKILIITTEKDKNLFTGLLGDGKHLGIEINYAIQNKPKGIAEAFLIGNKFIGDNDCTLILGDNIFYGHGLGNQLKDNDLQEEGATIYAYRVSDPERYGVVNLDKNNKVISIEEKLQIPKSNYAITGLYYYDNSVLDRVKDLKPSERGELEITDINKSYLKDGKLNVNIMSRGTAWMDTGTLDSYNSANNFIKTIEKRQGLKIGCPEEIAWRMGWINDFNLRKICSSYNNSSYGEYLLNLIKEN